jgi:tetratricopeptide (TPR) repeat protein/tRNA A-37 threonylcarbamoyl transferase component Bud32
VAIDTDRLKAALASRYAIEREIGRGGMAVVYKATDLKHHRDVAVKVLLPELSASLGGERFLREIDTVAKLNHPHILALYDSGEADGFLFYVMPFVDGESLQELMDRDGALSIDDALQIGREVADALGYAHRSGVVHRDIKPANILLSEGHAVVADFGIARAVSEAANDRITRTGMILGSPIYMSPEQVSGDAELDGRSDIYSLGCMIYEMIAGEPPFGGTSLQSILARRMIEEPAPLSSVREGTPSGVEEAVIRALALRPADRYAEATEFASVLRRLEHAGGAGPRSGSDRAVRIALGVILVAVVVAGGLAVASWADRERNAAGTRELAPGFQQPSAGALPVQQGGLEISDLYLQGRTLLERRGAALRQAIPLFEAAIARDSTFAPAWAGLAEAYGLLPYYSDRADAAVWRHSLARAEETSRRALVLDPDLPEAHLALANALRDRRQWEEAEPVYRRALELNPRYAEAHQQLAELLAGTGLSGEALDEARTAVRLDPGVPVRLNAYGAALALEGRYAEAIEQLERAVELDPGLLWTRANLLWTRLLAGRYDAALGSLPDEFWLPDADRASIELMIRALADSSLRDAARAVQTVDAYPLLRALLGDTDGTLTDLERMVFDPPYGVALWLWYEPFEALGDDARFVALVERYALEP